MKYLRLLLILTALMSLMPANAKRDNIGGKDLDAINDSLLNVLDNAIKNSKQLRQQHDEGINSLRTAYYAATTWRARYDLTQQLYSKYSTYRTDSALHYLHLSLDAAQHMNDADKINACKCTLMKHYTRTGFFGEAVLTLKEIDPTKLSTKNKISYYDATTYLYNQLGFYTKSSSDQKRFYDISEKMKDTLMSIAPHNSNIWLSYMQGRYAADKNYKGALQSLSKWAKLTKPGEHDYAVMEYYYYQVYNDMNRPKEALYHLLLSTINDVTTVTYDEAAVFYLCRILRDNGDLKRARKFINYAYDASTIFGGKMKDWATMDMESINSKFQDDLLGHNRKMIIAIVLLAVLFLIVIALGAQILIQHQKMSKYAVNLKQINEKLNEANHQLHLSVEQNEEANKHLSEANDIKEKCIGTFFTLCTHYIESLNDIRTKTSKLLRNRKFEELADMTRSTTAQDSALQNLYSQFDNMFLTIYPDFVKELNALLEPDYQIATPKDGTLTTPLRIFALIRLGIDDSGKISRLLNLANSTVYNYRTRFRNHALGDRSAFEDKVHKIGTHENISKKETVTA